VNTHEPTARSGMRILFLTSRIPYPPQSGGTIKTAALLDHLGTSHSVRLACFHRHPLTPAQREWSLQQGHVDFIPLNRERTPVNLFRSYLARVPLSIERNRSREMAALVSKRLRDDGADVVFVDGWLMAQYLPAWFNRMRLLHQHNAEHVMWGRQTRLEPNPIRRALLQVEFRRVRSYETSLLSRFDTVFAVSEPDRRALLGLGIEPTMVRLLPNVADSHLLAEPPLSPDVGPTFLFLGTLSWEPNVTGLESFLRAVLPEILNTTPGARFVIAGLGAPPRLARRVAQTKGAELVGYVSDPEPLYRSARAFVDASRGGAGTRVKILNAMARGLPVVATAEAAEGLEVVPGEHLLVADDPRSMAEAIGRLIADRNLWLTLSRKGRDFISRHHVAERAFGALDEVLSVPAGDT
jgi:glycosyltransferase involved in cell wall biosynthesis